MGIVLPSVLDLPAKLLLPRAPRRARPSSAVEGYQIVGLRNIDRALVTAGRHRRASPRRREAPIGTDEPPWPGSTSTESATACCSFGWVKAARRVTPPGPTGLVIAWSSGLRRLVQHQGRLS
jgi:hypothetical protein